ncbi:mitogen-activated protein kinase kinase kinase [Pycnococcus provasolii]
MGNILSLSNLNCLGGGARSTARPAASQQQPPPPQAQAQSNAHQSIAHSHSASTLVADLNASTPQDQATTSSSVGIIRPLSSGTQATNHQGLAAPPPAAASSSANTTPVDTSESGSDVPLTKGQFMRRRKWSFGLGCGAHGPQSDMMVSEPVPATTAAALPNTQHQQQHPTPPPALQPTTAPAFPQSDDNPSPPAVSGQSDNASSGGKPKRRHHHHHHHHHHKKMPLLPPAPKMPRRWKKGDAIGSGSFGSVFLGLNSDTGELLAVKEVPVSAKGTKHTEALQQLESEVVLLAKLQHPNIVRYVGTIREEANLYIFLEYVPGGSIASLLARFGRFEESVIRVYTRQILSGLAYLHAMRTAHRDIKGANILVERSGRVKLADFGMAKQMVEHMSVTKSFKGSAFWMAPEVVRQQGHGCAADVWSVGCTVLEMASGKPPWSQCSTQVQAIFLIASSSELPTIPETLSPDATEAILLCLQREERLRPSAEALLKHGFVADAEVPTGWQAPHAEDYHNYDDRTTASLVSQSSATSLSPSPTASAAHSRRKLPALTESPAAPVPPPLQPEQSATSLATDAASELSNPDTLAAAASTSPPSSSTMGGGGGPGSPPDAFRARGLIGLPPVKPPMSSHPFGVR